MVLCKWPLGLCALWMVMGGGVPTLKLFQKSRKKKNHPTFVAALWKAPVESAPLGVVTAQSPSATSW